MPQITLPTRLSDARDTLIDNIFTNNFEKNHKNFILIKYIIIIILLLYLIISDD